MLIPACAPGPGAAPTASPAVSARQGAERWIAAQGLSGRTSGPEATIGIGSASLGRQSATDPESRRVALRAAEVDARGAIARARGERVAATADAAGSTAVGAATDVVTLRGASVIRTEEVTDAGGGIEFAVVVRADPPGAAMEAPQVQRLDVPPEQWARSVPVDELARNVGARRVMGPDGVVHIMAFGKVTARGGRDAMAREKARMEALGAIRRFIDEDVTASSSASEHATRSADGQVSRRDSATSTAGSSSSAKLLPATVTAHQWRTPNPDGSTTVGVVLLAREPRTPSEPAAPPAPPSP